MTNRGSLYTFMVSFAFIGFFLLIGSNIYPQHYPDTLKPLSRFQNKIQNTRISSAENALKYYLNSICKSSKINDLRTHLNAALYLADLYAQFKIKDSCFKYIQFAEENKLKNGLDSPEINYQINKICGKYYYNTNSYTLAIDHLRKSLAFKNATGKISSEEKLFIYDLLSTSFSRLQIIDSTFFYVGKSDSILYQMQYKDTMKLLRNSWKIGMTYYNLGKSHEALDILLESTKLINPKKPLFIATNIYYQIGIIYKSLRELDKSIQYYEQTIKAYEFNNYPQEKYASVFVAMANAHIILGNYHQALQLLTRSIDIRIKTKDPLIMYEYLSKAYAYEHLDSLQQADTYYKYAIDLLKNNYGDQAPKLLAQFLVQYGNFKLFKLNDIQGSSLINEAITIYKNHFGDKYSLLAECYAILGDAKIHLNKSPDDALKFFQAALISNDSEFSDTSFYQNPNLNYTLSKKILLDILQKKATALQLKANELKNPIRKLPYLNCLQNTLSLAIETNKSISTSFTSLDSKLKMNENTELLFSKLISNCISLYELTGDNLHINNAYQYAVESKQSTLNDLINENDAKISANVPSELLQKETKLKLRRGELNDKIASGENDSLRNELFILEQEIAMLTKHFEDNYQKYYELKYHNKLLKIKDIQQMIENNQTIVEYYLADTLLYEFVITKDTIHILSTHIPPNFQELIRTVSLECNKSHFEFFDESGFEIFKANSYKLYEILIKPLASHLMDQEIIIVPHKELLLLPFELLITDESVGIDNYRKLPYLILNNPISYSYSTSWLFNSKQKKFYNKKLLAIVPSYDIDIDYENIVLKENQSISRENLKPIPAALEEADYIFQLFDGDILKSENATEAMFKKNARHYSILHFAMHTIIDSDNPMFSKLIFTPNVNDTSNKEDDMLNTFEIFNLDLNAQMVVLSSCKSGYGRLQKGEGIMSMARGFIFAGCPSLAITLWSVDDQASSDLMKQFYKNLNSGMSKSKALQLAKTHYLKQADVIHTHPHFWAAHIIVGDPDSLHFRYFNTNLIVIICVGIILIFCLLFYRRSNQKKKQSLRPYNYNNRYIQ